METEGITEPSNASLADELASHLDQMVKCYFSDSAPNPPSIEIRAWISYQVEQKLGRQSRHAPQGRDGLPLSRTYYLPSHDDWTRLSSGIQKLASRMGISKTGFGNTGSCARRIEHDYPKFKFADFITAAGLRLQQFPVPPLTKLHQLHDTFTSAEAKMACHELFALLGGRHNHISGKLYDILPDHLHDLKRFEPLLKRMCPEPYRKFMATLENMTTEQRYLVFEALQAEQARWDELYHADFNNSAPTLYLFQDERIYAALRRVLHGQAPNPAQIKKVFRKIGATKRQRKHRANK